MPFILMKRLCFCCQIMKKIRLLHASTFVTINGWILILKKGGKTTFSYETKVSMSSIPIRKMCLWCPIMKRKEIITCIHVCPYSQWILILRSGGRKAFLCEANSSLSFIPIRRMCLWCPIKNKKEIITFIHVCPY